MRILVTGADGFLGLQLCQKLRERGLDFLATGRRDKSDLLSGPYAYQRMDFTDPNTVEPVFENYKPETVIHAGGMTQVDLCELYTAEAYRTNVEGTQNLLRVAGNYKSHFIYVSTDFVFDGSKGNYCEEDTLNPINYYGVTKAEAESATREYVYPWSIVRTSLVYGKALQGKGNILTIVADHLKSGKSYKVVDDQFRSPTFVSDLAGGIVSMAEKKAPGIFHLAGKEVLTPYAMALSIAHYLGSNSNLIIRVTKNEFTQAALRPENTSLLIEKARNILDYSPVSFTEGMAETFI